MAEVGRPTKLTDETVRKLEEVFAIDGTVEEACFYADISRDTYYTWIKDNKSLSDRFESLRQRPFLKARQTIVKSLDNPHDAQWYLTRKKKLEFGDNVDVTSGGKPLPLFDYVANRNNNSNGEDTKTEQTN